MHWLHSIRTSAAQAQIPVYAANGAFFLLLSVFPSMTLLIPLLERLALSRLAFFATFRQLIPQVLVPLFREASALARTSAPMRSLSVLTGLWSASRGIYGLMQGLRRICTGSEQRSPLRLRLLAVGYTLAFLLALVVTFCTYSFGQQLLLLLRSADSPFGTALRFLLHRRSGFAFLFLSALFLLILRACPPEPRTVRQALPGALLTAGGWVLFSRLFSLWTERFYDYSRVYGSIAVTAMTMLWLYFCFCIILLGALLNEKLKTRRH